MDSPKSALEDVLDAVDVWELAFLQDDFDDIEAPRDFPSPEESEPLVGTASDELLLLQVHRVEGASKIGGGAGFDFGEEQQFALSCHDVDFAAMRGAEILVEDFGSIGAQPGSGDFFAAAADFGGGDALALSIRQAAA